MKNIFLTLIITITCFSHSFAQEWITDFDTAKETATKENKSIILVFQGSDWCGPCIKLDKSIWSTTEFQKLAEDHFVMLQADFPRRKKNKLSKEQTEHNAKLADQFNPNGYFPLVVVLNSEGDVLGRLGYEKSTPEAYFKKLKQFEK